MNPFSLLVSLSTFNIRGLGANDERKMNTLDQDLIKYKCDIIAIQETKVTESFEYEFPVSGNKLFVLDQLNKRHRGIGFVISKRFLPHILRISRISDNVAFVDLEIPSRNGDSTRCRVINAYGPTTPAAEKNPKLLDDFYNELSSIVSVPSNNELFICGDFNSRLGKLNDDDISMGINSYMGRYGVGQRNNNGSRLLEFLISNDLFACNTAFPHKSRHITTRIGYVKDWDDPLSGKTKPFYSMIDYIICKRRFKKTLTNARSYYGTLTESDHKIVCARFMFQDRHLTFAKRYKSTPKYECASLSSRSELQTVYSDQVSDNITQDLDVLNDPLVDCNTKVEKLVDSLKNAATQVIGIKHTNKPLDYCNDDEVARMSAQRHKLRLQLNNNDSKDRSSIRAEINKLKKLITKRLKHLKGLCADQLAETITNTDESRQMFQATRELKNINNRNNQQNVSVHDENNTLICNDVGKAAALRTWFQCQFTANNTELPLEPFDDGPARPLNNPITPSEVQSAAKALKNNRATGPDGVQNELLKYGGTSFYTAYSDIINNCFETNTHLKAVGEAVITPLQKHKKPKGPLKNIRPLTLSNSARKMLSLLTLRRIQKQVDQYTGPWQSAYKQGRSCSDIVWSQRMLTSVVMQKKWSFHKMGIDMSSAFDTIRRSTILNLLADAGCSEDEIRLVRFLLANTVLRVQVNYSLSAEFVTTLGSFQGDSLSGCLFTLVLAGALNHLRTLIPYRSVLPYHPDTLMPQESEYADDVDFMDEDEICLQFILPIANHVLREWSLNINCSKTEFVHFFLAEVGSLDNQSSAIRDNEPWRKSKLLGSYMCSSYDIERRCISGNIAFTDYKNVWLQGKNISTARLMKVYQAMVTSVIMYNCSSWAVTNSSKDLKKLDICQRKHLRQILKIKWPTKISNTKLYETCETTPLSTRVKQSRWRLLGHILRSPENTPAALALNYAVVGASHLEPRCGRHKSNLLNVIRSDINKIPVDKFDPNELLHQKLKLKTQEDIDILRTLALDRKLWRRLSYYVI